MFKAHELIKDLGFHKLIYMRPTFTKTGEIGKIEQCIVESDTPDEIIFFWGFTERLSIKADGITYIGRPDYPATYEIVPVDEFVAQEEANTEMWRRYGVVKSYYGLHPHESSRSSHGKPEIRKALDAFCKKYPEVEDAAAAYTPEIEAVVKARPKSKQPKLGKSLAK